MWFNIGRKHCCSYTSLKLLLEYIVFVLFLKVSDLSLKIKAALVSLVFKGRNVSKI